MVSDGLTHIYFAHGVGRLQGAALVAVRKKTYALVAVRKKIMITSLRPLRSLRENKKPASAARGKASDSRQCRGGVYPHPLCETQCRGGVYPHPPSATKTYSLGEAARYPFNAWCPTVAGCG